VRVVLGGLGDRTFGLHERQLRRLRCLRQRASHRGDQEPVGLLPQRERRGFTGAADNAAGGGREPAQPLWFAAPRTARQLGHDPSRQEQLQTKGEAVLRAGMDRVGAQQRELVDEQPEHLGVGLAALEQAANRVAGSRSRIERGGALTQQSMDGNRIRTRDGVEVAPPLMQHHPDVKERLEPRSEPAPGPPDTLRNRPEAPVMGRIQVQDPVRLAVADRAQHDCFGFQRAGHNARERRSRRTKASEASERRERPKPAAILCEVMKSVTIYMTDYCSLCMSAKKLLERRGVVYEEINLARDADSREQLSSLTGMFTFPQIVIDGQPIGGFAELLAADREGRLGELLAA
jgi:glutaredoxin 3